eukprot:Gb_24337 [translate_table: standard]
MHVRAIYGGFSAGEELEVIMAALCLSKALLLLNVVVICISIASARPLAAAIEKFSKENIGQGRRLQLDVERQSVGKDSFRVVYSMLPKGPVPPSGPSHCHNSHPDALDYPCRH